VINAPSRSDTGNRVITKGCERCRGDLFFQADRYGPYYDCLQCGTYYETSPSDSPLPSGAQAVLGRPPPVAGRGMKS
jgi:hypothetical protein